MKSLLLLLLLFSPLAACPKTDLDCDQIPPLFSLQPSDKFEFGRLWHHIKALEEKDLLYGMIQSRKAEIKAIKAHWKEKVPTFEDPLFQEELGQLSQSGSLTPSDQGCGAAYFLKDSEGAPRYVIKPFDEDILCLNNRKHFASPYNNRAFRVRVDIPLYRTAQAEALSYAIAKLLKLDRLIPATHLAIFTHPSFYDFGEKLKPADQANLYALVGAPDREKLCSVQKYVPDIEDLYHLVELWLEEGLSEQEILEQIPMDDFEDLVLLIWLLYDTDAHAGNLYVQKMKQGPYRLIKIDNGLTFPEKNSYLQNALYFFPHANRPLSARALHWLRNIPIEKITELIRFYELDKTLDAFYERVEILQKLADKSSYTMREIHVRMRALALPNGTEVALSPLSTARIQGLLDRSIQTQED